VAAARDYEELHRLVDRLSPEQVQRLRVFAEADPELHELLAGAPADQSADAPGARQRLLALAGIWRTGPSDAAVRHDELIRERLARSS
jgi:hypothetical protein